MRNIDCQPGLVAEVGRVEERGAEIEEILIGKEKESI